MKTAKELQREYKEEDIEARLKVINFLEAYPLSKDVILQALREVYKRAVYVHNNEREMLKRMNFRERAMHREYWRIGGAREIMRQCVEQAKQPEYLEYEWWVDRNDITIIKRWGYKKWLQEMVYFGRPFATPILKK